MILNLWALVAAILISVKAPSAEQIDFSLAALLYIVLSVYGILAASAGYFGLRITYYFGVASFIWYFVELWQAIGSSTGINVFMLTLVLYPFLLPPFPLLGGYICVVADWLILRMVNKK